MVLVNKQADVFFRAAKMYARGQVDPTTIANGVAMMVQNSLADAKQSLENASMLSNNTAYKTCIQKLQEALVHANHAKAETSNLQKMHSSLAFAGDAYLRAHNAVMEKDPGLASRMGGGGQIAGYAKQIESMISHEAELASVPSVRREEATGPEPINLPEAQIGGSVANKQPAKVDPVMADLNFGAGVVMQWDNKIKQLSLNGGGTGNLTPAEQNLVTTWGVRAQAAKSRLARGQTGLPYGSPLLPKFDEYIKRLNDAIAQNNMGF